MKKNIKYIVAAVAGLWLTGCTDDLDRFPLSSLSPETYFNTEEELETFTNHFYSQFPSAASGYGESEDIVNIFTLPATTIGLTRTVPTKGGGWNWDYLREINLYLKYSHRCNNKIAREHYDGIARFFRAYFYFEKVKRFGDVPWYNKPLESNDPDLKKPRDSRQLVMDSIMSDIDYAINYCDDNSELYRVTKWTAMALKSRICLFEGTFRKYHGIAGYETFLEECATISKRFIDESPYSIYTSGDKPYRDLFASMNAIQQEVILARDYDYTKGVKHEANYNTMAQTYGRPGMNKKIVNSYLMTDGTRFTDQPGYETMQYYDEMQNRDPRLTQTVVGPGYMRINSTTVSSPNFGASTTGYQITKWVTDASGDGYLGSSNDYILFRAAEVYLNYAEAKYELTGSLTIAELDKSINLIRDRVGMPHLTTNPDADPNAVNYGYTVAPLLYEIRRERRIELVGEGFRFNDIIRWKAGKLIEGVKTIRGMKLTDELRSQYADPSSLNNIAVDDDYYIIVYPSIATTRKWNDKSYLYPLPTDEKDRCHYEQNPGWN